MSNESDLITIPVACRLLGGDDTPINPSTLWRWIKAGRYSPPIKVGAAAVRFKRSVLLAERDRGVAA